MNADAALRANEMDESDVRRRCAESRLMVLGSEADILFAAIGIIEQHVHTIGRIAGYAMVAQAWGYARALLQMVAVGLDREDRAS